MYFIYRGGHKLAGDPKPVCSVIFLTKTKLYVNYNLFYEYVNHNLVLCFKFFKIILYILINAYISLKCSQVFLETNLHSLPKY